MSKSKALIIVESPAKIKTLKKFLGEREYLFESSVGHIRDLPQKEFGIDIEQNFEPTYVTLPDKKDVIKKLIQAAKEADTVYLSPDPDREGEAIAWHIASILPKGTKIKRATFHSITKDAVLKALENPRDIDYSLVDAQQARRLLDRIVGYKISPILNRRIQRGRDGGLSAGRVQSVALKLVVEREKEILKFVPVEYWNIAAMLHLPQDERLFRAILYSVDGKRIQKEAEEEKEGTTIGNKERADEVVRRLEKARYHAGRVEKKEKRRNPVAPFITSTLQQEASRHFGFSTSRTMSIAQTLYEGVDMGKEGTEGLITYMRTDSVRLAPEAITEMRAYIKQHYGDRYLPDAPRIFSTKKSAQDAHEAIRPTNFQHPPETVRAFLSREQFMIYDLVWKRTLASQMSPAVYDTISADIETDQNIVLRATGSVLKFPGFLAVYEEKTDDDKGEGDDSNKTLPPLEENQKFNLNKVTSEQAFTRPPPRFTEASLVKELEKSGIGRPSTYAAIMNKIQSRDYTFKESGRLQPTELGFVIAEMLETNFTEIMNIDFTANMEDELELVAANKKNWRHLIRDFWTKFLPTLETAEKEAFVPKVLTDLDCPKCGKKLQKIWARSKYFYGCSGYPECDFTAAIELLTFNKEDYAENFDWEQKCPECSGEMKLRHGRFGAFLGCVRYPDCKGIVNIPKKGEEYKGPDEMPSCPAVGCTGKMVARKSRFGKYFYSCSTFPECDVIVNDLDQLTSKYPNHPKTAYVKKERFPKKGKKGAVEKKEGKTTAAKGRKGAASKAVKKTAVKKDKKPSNQPSLTLSKELAAVVGEKELSRPQVMKKVWEYIKAHNLQDSQDKRKIKPDAALKKLFGSDDPVDMFQLAKLLGPHLKKP